ncbi:MAG: lipopolysaccharide biosynthesis protein, partial [Gemmiger sp.]|nr:lipopolysaccharide biosynthesis protein [Gemmiger sp.]
ISQISNLLIPVVSLGVSFAIIRFGMDKKPDRSAVFTNGLVTILLGFFLMLLAWPLVRLIPDVAGYIVLVYFCVLMSCLRTLCTQFVRARMINRLVAIDGILTSATLFGGYILYINVLQLGAVGYILAIITSDAISTVFVFLAGRCWPYLNPKKFSARLWREMLRYCVPMIPASISFWVINASDLFFVRGMCDGYGGRSGNAWVGLLNTGYFFPSIVSTLGQIFYEAWQLSAVTEEENRAAFFSRVFRVYACVMFCCAAGIIWLCQPLMLAFKHDFYDAWQFVPFLTLGSLCTCMNLFLNSVYVVFKRSTGSLYTMLAGAVVNLVLNYLFILWVGPIGVAPASFLALLLVFVLRAYSTRGLLEIDFNPTRLLVNLGLILAEIAILYLGMPGAFFWNALLTAGVIFYDRQAVGSMANLLLGRFFKRKKA